MGGIEMTSTSHQYHIITSTSLITSTPPATNTYRHQQNQCESNTHRRIGNIPQNALVRCQFARWRATQPIGIVRARLNSHCSNQILQRHGRNQCRPPEDPKQKARPVHQTSRSVQASRRYRPLSCLKYVRSPVRRFSMKDPDSGMSKMTRWPASTILLTLARHFVTSQIWNLMLLLVPSEVATTTIWS